jgi:SAM-dependent methyltransferase
MTGNDASGRALWAQRSVGWLQTAPKGESPDDSQNQALMSAVGVAPGGFVLDLASGGGEPAISIALRVGPEGRVVASDFSPEMLAGVGQRAAALGLAQLRIAVADMQSLPFTGAIFDAVTCRSGLMFPADRVAAASEARRVLKPGARAAFLVWGPLADNALHETLGAAVRGHFGEAGPSKTPKRHELGAKGALSAVLEAAGFARVEEREFKTVREFNTNRDFWVSRIRRNHAGHIDSLPAREQGLLVDRVIDAFEPYRHGDGHRLPQHVRMGIGTAPG